jgi:hypothetical protein
MNVYEALALGVDILHLVVIVYWVGGFFVSSSRHPKFRKIHGTFGVVVFTIQLVFSFRCPLVLISGYLRELAHPGFTDNWLYQPFIVGFLKSAFGFTAPDVVITVITAIGTGLMIVTLLNTRRPQATAD